jgi:aryl-alcohol dehydrogenase-like predicted oxidoreductase
MIPTASLGRSGSAFTRLGLGTWAIGGPWRFGWGPVDDAESIAVIRRAVEAGINWIDTAPIYGLGHSEEIVGRALKGYATMRLGRPEFTEPQLSQNLALVERLRAIADDLVCGVAELAIAWTLAQEGVTGAIVGALRPSQLDQWIGAGRLELSEELLGTINDAIAEGGAGTEELPTPPRPSGDVNVRAARP